MRNHKTNPKLNNDLHKPLSLRRETLRSLAHAQLTQVAGGAPSAACSHFASGCCWE